MFPFGGSAVVPFLDHRMAGDERRRCSEINIESPRVSWRPVGLSQAATMED